MSLLKGVLRMNTQFSSEEVVKIGCAVENLLAMRNPRLLAAEIL